jgi:hypothetical protein
MIFVGNSSNFGVSVPDMALIQQGSDSSGMNIGNGPWNGYQWCLEDIIKQKMILPENAP